MDEPCTTSCHVEHMGMVADRVMNFASAHEWLTFRQRQSRVVLSLLGTLHQTRAGTELPKQGSNITRPIPGEVAANSSSSSSRVQHKRC